MGHQRHRQQPHADRPAHGRPGQPRAGARPLQPVLHRRRPPGDRRRRGPSRARLPRAAHDAAAHALQVPQCAGVDHMDYTADGRLALVSCEFARPHDRRRPRGASASSRRSSSGAARCPRTSSSPRRPHVLRRRHGVQRRVADRRARACARIRFQPTGRGAHGLYPSRDAGAVRLQPRRGLDHRALVPHPPPAPQVAHPRRRLARHGRRVGQTAACCGSAAATTREVYALSTRTGRLLHRIKVGSGPHGLAVWPQPGRYSIGHTGILR